MYLGNIPKVFWYSLSACMLAVTFGFLYLAYKATSVSVEIAHTKVELLNAAREIKEANKELAAKEVEIQKTVVDVGNSTTRPYLTDEIKRDLEIAMPKTSDINRRLDDVQQQLKSKD
jgi:hypothetical protein